MDLREVTFRVTHHHFSPSPDVLFVDGAPPAQTLAQPGVWMSCSRARFDAMDEIPTQGCYWYFMYDPATLRVQSCKKVQ